MKNALILLKLAATVFKEQYEGLSDASQRRLRNISTNQALSMGIDYSKLMPGEWDEKTLISKGLRAGPAPLADVKRRIKDKVQGFKARKQEQDKMWSLADSGGPVAAPGANQKAIAQADTLLKNQQRPLAPKEVSKSQALSPNTPSVGASMSPVLRSMVGIRTSPSGINMRTDPIPTQPKPGRFKVKTQKDMLTNKNGSLLKLEAASHEKTANAMQRAYDRGELSEDTIRQIALHLPVGKTRQYSKVPLGKGVEGPVYPSITGGEGLSAVKQYSGSEKEIKQYLADRNARMLGLSKASPVSSGPALGARELREKLLLEGKLGAPSVKVHQLHPRGYVMERMYPAKRPAIWAGEGWQPDIIIDNPDKPGHKMTIGDLHPDNIMQDAKGRRKIVDFALREGVPMWGGTKNLELQKVLSNRKLKMGAGALGALALGYLGNKLFEKEPTEEDEEGRSGLPGAALGALLGMKLTPKLIPARYA